MLSCRMGILVRQKRLKNFFQGTPSPQNARFHRSDAALQNLSDLLVTETLQVAQYNGDAKNVRNTEQGTLYDELHFAGGQLFEGRGAKIFDFKMLASFFQFGIDGDGFLKMPFKPAPVVERFANGDAVQPSLQGTAVAETTYTAKCFQKNFLGAIGGIRSISEHTEDQIVDRSVVMSDEPDERSFGTGL